MRKTFLLLLSLLSFAVASAQITAPVIEEKPDTDSKYLVGAVPEVNGKVVLSRTIDMPASLTQDEAVKRIDSWLERCAKDDRVRYQTRLPQPAPNELQQNFTMELTFSKTFISHDFANISYVLSVRVQDGKAIMEMSHIAYNYYENNKNNRYTAEEMITDKYALKKSKDKLVFGYKKFRMKTIDLLDELQISLTQVLNNN